MKLLPAVFLIALGTAAFVGSSRAQSRLYQLPVSERAPRAYALGDEIGRFEHGPAPLKIGAGYVYVDRSGKVVLPLRGQLPFDYAGEFGANGLAAVSHRGKFGYITPGGEWRVPAQFDMAESFWNASFAIVRANEKWGVLAADGSELIPVVYDAVESIEGGGFTVFDGHAWTLASPTGELLQPFKFEALRNMLGNGSEGLVPARRDDRWGFVSAATGEVVVPMIYEKVGRFSEGRANFVAGEKIGYVDRTGRVIVEPRFESADEFSEGLAAVQLDGRWGYLDLQGELAIAPAFDRARKFSGGYASVKRDNEWLTIDRRGEFVTPPPDAVPTEEHDADAAQPVTRRQRSTVRYDHINVGMTLLWDEQGRATETRVFRLDNDETVIWDARLTDGLVHDGFCMIEGKPVIFGSHVRFQLDALDEQMAAAWRTREKTLGPVISANVTSGMKQAAVAALMAISNELKGVENLERIHFADRHRVDHDAANDVEATINRIMRARPYVNRVKALAENIEVTIRDREGLNDDQRRLLDRIRNKAALAAQEVLGLK